MNNRDASVAGDWRGRVPGGLLALVAVPVLVWAHRRMPLGNGLCLGLFVFGVLHEVGAHYTYSEVPWDAWFRALLGGSPNEALGLGRNHYDRLVHFAYGLLVTPVAMHLIEIRARPQGAWRWLLLPCINLIYSFWTNRLQLLIPKTAVNSGSVYLI